MTIKTFLPWVVVGFLLSACQTNFHNKKVKEAETNFKNWQPQKMYRIAGFAWVELANLYGHPQAAIWQRNVIAGLSQEEINEGKMRVLKWKPKNE
ncbi:MAG: hypothetical protein VX780_04070 [Pseudomonadota bacterium]|nr:hypothetical protein [Pseudomonadota bacterium]